MSRLNLWLVKANVIVWGVVILMTIKGCAAVKTDDSDSLNILLELTADPCVARFSRTYRNSSEIKEVELGEGMQ